MKTVEAYGMEIDLGDDLTLEDVVRMQLPAKICHCPECVPDPRCNCERCYATRGRLVTFAEQFNGLPVQDREQFVAYIESLDGSDG